MIHAEGRGCQHGFSSDLFGPRCVPVAWRSWGPSLSLPTACPDPRDPARDTGPGPGGFISLRGSVGLEPRGLTAAAPGRLRQRPKSGPAGPRGSLHCPPSVPLPRAISGRYRRGGTRAPPRPEPSGPSPAPTPGSEPEPLRRPRPPPRPLAPQPISGRRRIRGPRPLPLALGHGGGERGAAAGVAPGPGLLPAGLGHRDPRAAAARGRRPAAAG